MRVEVRLEKLIIESFPEVHKADFTGGRLADLVVAILDITIPGYRSYQEEQEKRERAWQK
jgi:hypothetical protein